MACTKASAIYSRRDPRLQIKQLSWSLKMLQIGLHVVITVVWLTRDSGLRQKARAVPINCLSAA